MKIADYRNMPRPIAIKKES